MLGFFQTSTVAIGLGSAFVIQRLLARFQRESVALGKTLFGRGTVITEFAGLRLGVEKGQCKRFDLLPVIDTLGIQLLVQVIDDLRVGHVGQLSLGVVRQEGVENVLRLVEEIEDKGFFAVTKGAV